MIRNFERLIEKLQNESRSFREVKWIEQLQKEHESICFQFGIKLSRPIFLVSDAISYWASWNSQTKTITVSSQLLTSKPWHVVLGVLKHEMAHQLADEQLNSTQAHGAAFQIACDVLGIDQEFRRSHLCLGDYNCFQENPNVQTTPHPILRKVEKLLALAESSNESEACAAMEKAQELCTRHNIETAKQNMTQTYARVIIDTQRKKVDKTYTMIASILQNHYFVKIIYSSTFHACTCEETKTLEIMGSKENVQISEYVFHFLLQSIKNLWSVYQRKNKAPGSQRSSYQMGLLMGFENKIEKIVARNNFPDESKALIRTIHAGVNEYISTIYPKLSTRTSDSRKVDSTTFHAGFRDGGNIVVHKGVTEKKTTSTLLLNP